MAKLHCSLDGCEYSTGSGTGLAAHERGHIVRDEAVRNPEGKLIGTGRPIVTGSYQRKMRMQEIKDKQPAKEQSQAEAKGEIVVHKKTRRVSRKRKHRKQPVGVINIPSGDLSTGVLDQVEKILDQHELSSSPQSLRTVGDILTQAAVFARVAEMMSTMPAEQVLQIFSTMHHLPALPRSQSVG